MASYHSAANESPMVETLVTKPLVKAWDPPDHIRMNPPRLVFTYEAKTKIYFRLTMKSVLWC